MDGEASSLEDYMVNTMRSYVPAIVLGALAQTRERREYAGEVALVLSGFEEWQSENKKTA